MARDLNKFTFEEGINALSPHAREWNVHDIYSWFDKDPSDVKTTAHIDVSDIYTLTVECGDYMCIKFAAINESDSVISDGGFNSDVAGGATGTHWDLSEGADWTISNGNAKLVAGAGTNTAKDLNAATADTTYWVTYTMTGFSGNDFTVRLGWDGNTTPRTADGTYSEYVTATGGNIHMYGNNSTAATIDNLSVIPLVNINKSTDFAIPPGVWTLKVPKGLGDRIIFSFLPYNEPVDKGHLYMKVVTH